MEGKCKHGTFDLEAGCPQCIAERQFEKMDGGSGATLALPDPNAWRTGDEEVRQEEPDVPLQGAMIAVNPGEDAAVIQLYWEAVTLQEYAETRTIESLSDLKAATADLNIIRKLKRTLEALRKEWLKPLQDATKGINADFAALSAPVIKADEITATKMMDFDNEQKRIRAEQEEVNRLRIEAAEKEAALNNGVITESVDLIKPVAEVPDFIRTDAGNSGPRGVWKWRVIDKNLVPREYLMIDKGVLTPVVQASKGKVPIPGIEQYNEPIIAVRG